MTFIIRANSLFLKAILVIGLIVIIAISWRVWLSVRMHERSIARANHEQAKIIAEFIEKNVIRAMEKGRHFEIHQILKNFTYRTIWKINVFRLDGTIKASTFDEELNKKVNNVELFITDQNFIREELVKKESGKWEKERIDYLNTPIFNRPECFQCHNEKEGVIAILSVANSHRELDEEISDVKKEAIFISLITIGAISSALGLLFLRFINVPIKKVTDAMKKVEKGDLNVRVDVKSRDEMGILADNLNIMIEKLNFAKEEAERYHQELIQRADRMASIGELASGIAHEIRNPLAGIQGAIQILAEGFPREDPRKEVTEEIQKQIYKLERLVKDLLNYAKPVPANTLPTDVNQLVDKVLSFFVTQQRRSLDFKIQKKLFSSLPKTMIDPNSMEQAFLNIILNAQKAIPSGGTFTVSTVVLPQRKEDGKEVHEVQIIFEDTGVGIPEENLPKIFNPFFSTRSDGTGLGLSITKNIVEQQGGKIEVESQVNVGTKFIITLPVMRQ
jgi:signal transduction histidine kinase